MIDTVYKSTEGGGNNNSHQERMRKAPKERLYLSYAIRER